MGAAERAAGRPGAMGGRGARTMSAWVVVLALFLILLGVHFLTPALPALLLAIVAFIAAVLLLVQK